MATTVVFSGGPSRPAEVEGALAGLEPDLVVAADSGLVTCLQAGLQADVVIGDMDSVPAAALADAEARGARIERRPRDKDATDLELALDLASELVLGAGATGHAHPGPDATGHSAPERDVSERDALLVVGSDGGRLDHLLASMLLVGSPRYRHFEVDARIGASRVLPVHERRVVSAPAGTTVSLHALHGDAGCVSVTGLRWPLEAEPLPAASSRGLSNVFLGDSAEVTVTGAPVTVLIPDQTLVDAPVDGP